MRPRLGLLALLALSSCTVGQSVLGGRMDAANDLATSPDATVDDTKPVDARPTDAIDVVDVADTADATVVADALDATPLADASDDADLPDVSVADAVDVVDAPFRCTASLQCAGRAGALACDLATGRCVECTPADDRCPEGQRCDAERLACETGCTDDDDCPGNGDAGLPAAYCDPASHACVNCVSDVHCPPGNRCVANACVPGCTEAHRCPGALACCAMSCIDTRASVDHCGACGAACALAHATPSCVEGQCRVASCAPSFADCDMAAPNGCEADLRVDASHCGACGRSATLPHALARCEAGAAVVDRCEAGYADCNTLAADGCEAETRGNNLACGSCGRACDPGARCVTGACVADCRLGGAVPCASGTVCDYTDGVCRDPGARCALIGDFQSCGAANCGPGSVCDPRSMTCVAGLACRAVTCEDGTGRCWGRDCPCDRPTAACATVDPAAVPSAFLSGAFGFDIDDACNLYTSTMLSGPDFVRRLDPAGRVTTWASVANLNMGEVAVDRVPSLSPGARPAQNVAFTYICCAACGCASTPPQGVGHVQSDGSLPVVVPAVVTTGAGPFGVNYLDTGPYGLGVSAVGEFFVGNVRANGDWFRYDVATRAITAVATLPARVTASTFVDLDTMLVAVEGGAVFLVDRAPGATPRRLGTLGVDVQSVRRDTFTGRFYASLRDRRVVSFVADLSGLRTETMPLRGSRVALSPDGWLYVLLEEGGPVSRVALPSSR